ncbi:Na+/H+ antiporter subunit A [Mumia zhuanghuii]|uniref:Na+/H+ antiporter subunit A n=2 Tax=Mumia TaxID=1546255 RepID=A0ABW1QJC7_9ACTN|nr:MULTISPECIES: Na+/H+ antiporter subunit A [Mumia]KAA1425541.1 Na+/H+ antiporter subunit A [Mumia zhuanghuii]
MLLALLIHLVAAAAAPALVSRLDRYAFPVLALAPASVFVWLLTLGGEVAGPDAAVRTETYEWVPTIGLEVGLRLDTLSWTLALLVTGIGALVLLYCTWYFRAYDPALWRFSGAFVAFAGSMLGLVLASDVLLLYVFWELTTVFSYILIGHNPERIANRRAAMTALLVTTFGGLAMLVGFIMLGESAGSYQIDAIMGLAPSGAATTAAIALVLVGAVSKSALVPFHFWLPGAMAAPTPVSAYLHAAAMVKAGVFLVAVMAPTFAEVSLWRPALLTLGVVTMIVGGVRALGQHDVKLLLAYGTVSQLGFLTAVVGLGTRAAALAGLAMVVAHALFKAALFMVVGIVDHSAHTRDLRKLSQLRPAMPWLFGFTVLAAASMAGIPPMLGFVAKESVYGAFVDVVADGDGTGIGPVAGSLVLAGLVVGSLLTMAYTLRFVWGVFGDKPGVERPADLVAVPVGFAAPTAVLATVSLVLGFFGSALTDLWAGYDHLFPPGVHHAELALWHGLSPALGLSAIAVLGGVALFVWQRRAQYVPTAPWMPSAERSYEAVMRGTDRLAVEVTGRTQRGSLPFYLGSILVVVLLVPGTALVLNRTWTDDVVWFDSAAQAVVAVLMATAAVLTVRSRRRLKAVLLAGVSGYCTAMLFLLHGAPDLALTQVLVETVTLVIFVLVLRRMVPYFSDRPLTRARWLRVGIGAASGIFASGIALAAAGVRIGDPVSVEFPESAVEYGGGHNIVNVTLVDIRAWDTMGELSVLVVAATGVASLIFLITGRGGVQSPANPLPSHQDTGRWLRAGRTLSAERRSIVFEIVTRLVFHTIILFSVWLVFAGHNGPGGGFAGGLMAGLALMVRYLAGGRYELDEAAPVDAGRVLGLGLAVATSAALAPLAFGGQVLQSATIDLHLWAIGDIHLVTSLFFDIGVYLVVFGLMLDVLRSLGGGIDADAEDEMPDLPGSYTDDESTPMTGGAR